jgi:hypothetical protein
MKRHTHHKHISRQVIKPSPLNRRKRASVGFQVHLPKYGLTHWFPISGRWNTEAQALRAAIAWRDRILRTPPTPAQTKRYKQRRAAENARRREARGHL